MSDYFEIDFFHVDAKTSGDAIGIRYQIGGATYIHIVDGGYVDTGEAFKSHIRQYYGNPGYIDHVIVTHPDGDHAGGLRTILENFAVGRLWMLRPWDFAEYLIDAFPTYNSVERLKARLRSIYTNIDALEEIAGSRGIPIEEPFQGAQIGAFHVLAPTPARYFQLILDSERTPEAIPGPTGQGLLSGMIMQGKKALASIAAAWGAEVFSPEETSAENEMSVVQYANLCDQRILLTGDAGRAALTEAADFAPNVGLGLPGIDRFQVPHHGSRRNLSTEVLDRWLGTIRQQATGQNEGLFTALISASKDDPDHPRKVVVRSMIHRGGRVFTTGNGGGLHSFLNANDRGWLAATALEYPDDMEED